MTVLRSGAAVCAALLLAGAAARADVKIVSEFTVKGLPTRPGAAGGAGGQPTRQTVTAYYKGNHVRTEAPAS